MENNTGDLRNRGQAVVDVQSLPGTIHPFNTNSKSLLHSLTSEVGSLLKEKQGKKIAAYITANTGCAVVLLLWSSSTNSMALTAFTYLTLFDILSLLTCLVSLWVQKQKPTPAYAFGYDRFEVLAVFASTLLAQLGSLFILKESVERMIQQPEIHTGRLLVGTALAFTCNILNTYSHDNKAFNHVIAASSSSWLQEHVADMSESICHVVPGLSKLLLPRINPFALIAFAGGFALIGTYVLIDINNYYACDTWAAVWIAMMICGTMFPMSVYSGKILLQTTPSHILGQLDKCIREASTLDGVLEFRHEHFWTLAFGTMAGSVHVRVRRDADEQLVLAHVSNRLSNLISVLTVQIFKDDWTRTSAYQIISDSSLLSKFPSAGGSSPMRVPLGNTDMNSILNSYGVKTPPDSPTNTMPYPNLMGVAAARTSPYGPSNAAMTTGRPYSSPQTASIQHVAGMAPSPLPQFNPITPPSVKTPLISSTSNLTPAMPPTLPYGSQGYMSTGPSMTMGQGMMGGSMDLGGIKISAGKAPKHQK